MRQFIVGGCVLALLGSMGSALAADLPVKAPPRQVQQMQIYNWTGWYIGGHIGGAWSDRDNVVGATSSGDNDGRFMAGVQGGFDYQFQGTPWVIGFEANYSWIDRSSNPITFPGGFVFDDRTRELFSATGRIGAAWGPALWYFKGGYAHRDSRQTFTGPGGAVAFAGNGDSDDGYTLGGGVEYMFMPNWSAKLEYQFYDFDNMNLTSAAFPGGTANFRTEEHTIKAGLNWRFNWGGGPWSPGARY